MNRAVSGHAAAVGIAGALSFIFADGLATAYGWRAAFAVSGACALAAFASIFLFAPWQPARAKAHPSGPLLDFRPVLRNRAAMAYAVAYCVHTWEMNTLRGWAVAFLAFAAAGAAPGGWLAPAAIVTLTALLGTAASVLGNEAALTWGRKRLVRLAMLASIGCAVATGFAGTSSYTLAVALVIVYGILIWLDSASLTAGTTGAAEPERRGATLAIHSMLGYAGGFVGPLAMGLTLDLAGGMTPSAWAAAFCSVALVVAAGLVAFEWLHRTASTASRRATTSPSAAP